MLERHIADWDNAYTNGANIAGGDRWPAAWVESAQTFRDALSADERAQFDIAYGDRPRNLLDLFLPEGTPKGLVVFVHGGYWMALDKSYWSHLAKGSIDSGYAVAMPSYSLCPEVRIGDIVREVGAAIGKAAALVEGPIMLTGHSAGGHLVSRMVAAASPLAPDVQSRIRHVVSLSGVHDLRPLINTGMNKTLHIDETEALAESPALLRPVDNVRITCWVGGGERAEFLRQNALLSNIWTGLGATTATVVEPDRHHFSVIDGLADKDHALTRTLLG
ncbi:esterase (plasmid) [Aminobacter sp. Y103A]|jgi:arylformamidase|uniref:Esterase n=1 Tax=Aminobacter aminovorans TaxID=83263 RepID=A0AAC9ATD6_AMIAI|nr:MULTISPECIES: alpha/beta hydrolase [Aminobacter]AMS44654.1 esterase [Aminobacter aminovorans]MBB3708428.1 acetyl esterase/lipase [Aminobacter aminovorans]BBD40794.1 esterase [Aminobacter sp. SS-2016]